LQEVPRSAEYEDTEIPLGGVGIVFVKDTRNNFLVNLMVRGGPAHKSKQIRQGDRLISIDGIDVDAGGKAGVALVRFNFLARHIPIS
jgi:C-terminal processing protease CtpA/Prc